MNSSERRIGPQSESQDSRSESKLAYKHRDGRMAILVFVAVVLAVLGTASLALAATSYDRDRSEAGSLADPEIVELLSKPRAPVSDRSGFRGYVDTIAATGGLSENKGAVVPPDQGGPVDVPTLTPVFNAEAGGDVVGYWLSDVGFVEREVAESVELDPKLARAKVLQSEVGGS